MIRKKKYVASEPKVDRRDEMKHQSWCLKNGIKIYFKPIDWRRGRIVIDNNGKLSESEEIYNQTKLRVRDKLYHLEIYKLYTKFYKEAHDGKI